MDEQTLAVRDDSESSRYVITVDGEDAGFSAYVLREDVVVFTHTEIDPRFEGRGVGSALARGALDDVRRQGRRIRPLCAFIAGFVRTHAEYGDLVVPAQ